MATIMLKFRPSSVEGKDGSLFFQIIHKRSVKQICTGLHISNNEWNHTDSEVIIPPQTGRARTLYLSSIKEYIKNSHRCLADRIAVLDNKRIPYTVQDVAIDLLSPSPKGGLVAFTRNLIEDLNRIGKKPAVKRYGSTLNSLLRYAGGNEVVWKELSPAFISGYESFLLKRGLCRNSTSFYIRNLRSIVNRAVERGIEVDRNLFRHVYTGVDKTVKRAVGIDVIRRIRDIDLSGHPALDFARKVFMFSFYTRGMSFVDIAFLKKSDARNGLITYSRRKTRQLLTVRIEPETKKIIESFGKNRTPFLLPILTDETADPEHQYENAYSRINRNIQKVGLMLRLDTKLTLYVARHSWASIAHSSDVALSTISRAMGHDSEKTTVIYLQSLDTSSVDKANSDIIRLMDKGKRKR